MKFFKRKDKKAKQDLIVLFDLEGTIITHWNNPDLINMEKVLHLLNAIKSANDIGEVTLGIYSYALWCKDNMEIAEEIILPVIEEVIDDKFNYDYVFSMDEILKDFEKKNNKIDYRAYCSVINKEKSILDFHISNKKFEGKNIVYVNSTVNHGLTCIYPKLNNKVITFININDYGDNPDSNT